MTSALEAEVAALFYNCKAAIPLHISLEEMGHPQPKTPAVTCERHGIGAPLRCFVLIRAQFKKPRSRSLLPHKEKRQRLRQRRHSNHLQDNQASNDLDIGSRSGRALLQLQSSNPTTHLLGRDGPSTTENTGSHRQHYGARSDLENHDPQARKIV